MSKSIHTTRRHYRKARDADFGSKQAQHGTLATLQAELDEKRTLKRDARRRRGGGRAGAPLQVKAPVRRAEEPPRPGTLPVVTLEEFGREKKESAS